MTARKLTLEQKDLIEGVFFNTVTFFNCIQDINNDWFIFLSDDDLLNLGNYQWLKDITLIEFTPKPQTNPL